MKNSLAIYVATHGPKCAKNKYLIPIELGASLRNNLRYTTRDNLGLDNISEKNKIYCELTGMYWIWKNDNHDLVGMCHYRRYLPLGSNKIRKILNSRCYDIISNYCYMTTSLYEHYKDNHIIQDFDIAIEIIKKKYPEQSDKLDKILKTKKVYFRNTFVTTKALFNDYCSWLFPILDELDRRVDISLHMNPNEIRYVGFLSERLFTIFLLLNNLKVYEVKHILIKGKCPQFLLKIHMLKITFSSLNKKATAAICGLNN